MNRCDDRACLCVSHARLRATRGQADRPGLYLQRIFSMKCVAIAYGQLRKDSLRIKEQVRAQQYS
jgi:hypothetical protein